MGCAFAAGDAIRSSMPRRFTTATLASIMAAIGFAAAAQPVQVVPVKADGPVQANWPTQVKPDTLSGDSLRTRFVVGFDRDIPFQVLTLPNRVVVELPDVKFTLPAPTDGPVGLVRGFTGGLAGKGRSRVLIDVTQPVAIENARTEPAVDGRGWQLVFDMVPVETGSRTVTEAKQKPLPKPSGLGAAGVEPPQPRQLLARPNTYKPTIVIDPGHGGHDSGATKNGTIEKDVVLAFSLALRDKLKATGRYNVLMTRDADVFVPLDDRRDFGERNNAQLFIAVHADYATTQARGATIYSLREGMFSSLKRSAKSQVADVKLPDATKAVHKQMGEDSRNIEAFLGDLAQREVEVNDNSTNLFRTRAIQEMDATTTMRDNPEQSANFRVLLSAKVPSVLIELAYVSNQQDAKLLKSEEWRSKVSDSIFVAIDNYFADQKSRLPM